MLKTLSPLSRRRIGWLIALCMAGVMCAFPWRLIAQGKTGAAIAEPQRETVEERWLPDPKTAVQQQGDRSFSFIRLTTHADAYADDTRVRPPNTARPFSVGAQFKVTRRGKPESWQVGGIAISDTKDYGWGTGQLVGAPDNIRWWPVDRSMLNPFLIQLEDTPAPGSGNECPLRETPWKIRVEFSAGSAFDRTPLPEPDAVLAVPNVELPVGGVSTGRHATVTWQGLNISVVGVPLQPGAPPTDSVRETVNGLTSGIRVTVSGETPSARVVEMSVRDDQGRKIEVRNYDTGHHTLFGLLNLPPDSRRVDLKIGIVRNHVVEFLVDPPHATGKSAAGYAHLPVRSGRPPLRVYPVDASGNRSIESHNFDATGATTVTTGGTTGFAAQIGGVALPAGATGGNTTGTTGGN